MTKVADTEVHDLLTDRPELLAVANLVVEASDGAVAAPVEPRPRTLAGGWRRGLPRRPLGRSRRFGLVIPVLVGLLAIVVPTAFALRGQILDAITGQPAPPAVARAFDGWNQILARDNEPSGHPFADVPQAVVGQAHGVLRLGTPDGAVDLWAAPERGGGQCFMLQITVPPTPGDDGFRSIGTCDSALPGFLYSNPEVIVPWPASFSQMPGFTLVLVRVRTAASVELAFADGSTHSLDVIDGFALAAVPSGQIPPNDGQQPVRVIAKDASGATIASEPLEHVSSVS